MGPIKMKKFLLSSVALLGLTVGAVAADLPSRRSPAPVVSSVPSFTWTGFYLGANAGIGWGAGGSNNAGFIGGGQAGFNYQMGSIVIGGETDLQYADIGTLNYFGTIRGRVGFGFDRALVYGTGGFAYGGGDRAGGGDETSGKVEGLYVNLNESAHGLVSEGDFGLLRAGVNVKF
jgi:outer membrane immunogenic protein